MKATFLALLVFVAGCGGSNSGPVNSAGPQSASVRSGTVFVGDSIIGGWDLDSFFPGKGYVNAGWFGKRTDEMLAVFPRILDGSKVCHGFDGTPSDPRFPFSCTSITPPARVVIFLGWNDLFQAKDSAQAAANINTMVQLAQNADVRVILIVPYRYDSAHPASWMVPWDSCSDLFPFRADQEPVLNAGIRAIPNNTPAQLKSEAVDLEALFTCQSDYTIDGIHPNASGFQQMHDAIAKALHNQG
jgi:hypothetical protein